MSQGSPVIEVREIEKRYSEVTVLNGVSLDIHAGETLVVLGPSG